MQTPRNPFTQALAEGYERPGVWVALAVTGYTKRLTGRGRDGWLLNAAARELLGRYKKS